LVPPFSPSGDDQDHFDDVCRRWLIRSGAGADYAFLTPASRLTHDRSFETHPRMSTGSSASPSALPKVAVSFVPEVVLIAQSFGWSQPTTGSLKGSCTPGRGDDMWRHMRETLLSYLYVALTPRGVPWRCRQPTSSGGTAFLGQGMRVPFDRSRNPETLWKIAWCPTRSAAGRFRLSNRTRKVCRASPPCSLVGDSRSHSVVAGVP